VCRVAQTNLILVVMNTYQQDTCQGSAERQEGIVMQNRLVGRQRPAERRHGFAAAVFIEDQNASP
jgi:hypothetical protein